MTKPATAGLAADPGPNENATTAEADPPYDPHAIFLENGPLSPSFMQEAVRSLIRCMPLDPGEPPAWAQRRMYSAMLALAALHPRDEIEVLLGVQAIAACHAAAACWRIGMNHHRPNGDSTRHIAAAATAARTFDSLLRALERRQAKPLSVPVGRPPTRAGENEDPTRFMQTWEARCRVAEAATPPTPNADETADKIWTPGRLAGARRLIDRARVNAQVDDLDLANTEGILPDGGMIMPDNPTPQQEAYMGRRLGLSYQRQWNEALRSGNPALPKIRAIRPGDLIA